MNRKLFSTFLFLFIGAFVVLSEDLTGLRRVILRMACQERCRKFHGKIVDLGPRFAHANGVLEGTVKQGAEPPLPEWELMYGNVFQVLEDGFLFNNYGMDDLLREKEPELVFVQNEKHAKLVVDGTPLGFYAIPDGRFSYQNTQGARKTIPKYDYGEQCSEAESSEVSSNVIVQTKRAISVESPPPENWKPRVMANIKLAGQFLTIRNQGKTDWPALTVILQTEDHSDFQALAPPMKAGESVSLSLTNFSSKAGQVLNQTNAFNKVSIGGNGFQFGAYRL